MLEKVLVTHPLAVLPLAVLEGLGDALRLSVGEVDSEEEAVVHLETEGEVE